MDRGRVLPRKPPRETAKEEAMFYTLPQFLPEPATSRIAQLLVHYRVYRLLVGTDDYCSRVLEGIVRASFTGSDQPYDYRGTLPQAAPLDGVYAFRDVLLGVEVKNIREWVHPTSGEAWVIVRKCLELDAVPLLITRKTTFIARRTFEELGILSFQFHRQVFAPNVAGYLVSIQHVDQLGYKDVIAQPIAAHPPLVQFLDTSLPALLADALTTWRARRGLLEHYAVNLNFGDPRTTNAQRQVHWPTLAETIFPREERDVGMDDDY